ncbi:hypothetical protein CYPRO_1493 [Cyclonatronum proteinivorum]|uniref:DUF5723 domain-containing protein n=1 Tax=Cyclonatronum proteinivorum TaxID=1457365 RepID=A0A345UJU7_9BACT|nr:DUF5723 family protein [Cyclonatronum proteinivorum]AXJ00749.1 hypothetical protein CYPRO_1493 [Cyclonatronum proteinivorum]
MTKSQLISVFIWIALTLGFAAASQAQHRLEVPETMAIGATGTAWAGGAAALHINPANLLDMRSGRPNNLVFLQSSATLGGGLLNVSTYNSFLTKGELLDAARQREMLDQWYGDDAGSSMQYAHVNAGFVLAGTAFQLNPGYAAGLSVRLRNLSSTGISRGAAELGLGGLNEDVFREGREADLMLEATSFAEVTAGFAMMLYEGDFFPLTGRRWSLQAGVSPQLFLGIAQSQLELRSRITVSGDDVHHDFRYIIQTQGETSDQLFQYLADRDANDERPEMGDYLEFPSDIGKIDGMGFGLNLGVTAQFELGDAFLDFPFLGEGMRILQLGLAFSDLGSIRYSRRAAVFENQGLFTWEGFAIDQQRIDEEFDGDLGSYFSYVLEDSVLYDMYLDFDGREVGSNRVQLPAAWAFGGELRAGRMQAAFDLGAGFSNSGLVSRRLALGVGASYAITRFVPVRAGWYSGGSNNSSWTFGTGLTGGAYRLDLGVMLSPGTQNGGAWAAIGLGALQFRF